MSRKTDTEFVENLEELTSNGQTDTPLICPTCEETHPAKNFTIYSLSDGRGMCDESGRGYSAGGGSSDIHQILCPSCFSCDCYNCEWCEAND